jgi:hypothetical protein
MDAWARLSLYESTDLVRGLFQARHQRELSAQKAREIVSAIAQGREYFSSADDAGLLVRPLLQYYGVLSLCRGLVLLLSPNLRETSLPQAHGLSSIGWSSVLGTEGLRSSELEAKVNNGTFLALLQHTQNSDPPIDIWAQNGPHRSVFPRRRAIAGLEGFSLTFRQVLARVSELRDTYERSLGECAENYRAFVSALSADTHTDVRLFPGRHGLPTEQHLRVTLGIPANIDIRRMLQYNLFLPEPHLTYRVLHPADTTFIELIPQVDSLAGGGMSVVSSFAPGVWISRIGRFFLLSYFLGTLARYHPTGWLAIMQSRQKGDFMLPIIRESMAVIQGHFPALVVKELEG